MSDFSETAMKRVKHLCKIFQLFEWAAEEGKKAKSYSRKLDILYEFQLKKDQLALEHKEI